MSLPGSWVLKVCLNVKTMMNPIYLATLGVQGGDTNNCVRGLGCRPVLCRASHRCSVEQAGQQRDTAASHTVAPKELSEKLRCHLC